MPLRIMIGLAFASQLALWLFSLYYLPIDTDEGWNLCVARTWLESGHYGCLLLGEGTTQRLATGIFPITIAKLGFILFGTDYLSGRLIFFLIGIGALGILYFVTNKLYGKRTALLALLLYLFISADNGIHIVKLSAASYAEALVIFFFGIIALLMHYMEKSQSSLRDLIITLLIWVLGAQIFVLKIQSRPFLVVALLAASLTFLYRKQRQHALLLGGTTLGIAMTYQALELLSIPTTAITVTADTPDLLESSKVLGFNMTYNLRVLVVTFLISSFWILFLGHGSWLMKQLREKSFSVVEAFLVTLWGSYTLWFALFSIDYPRYYSIGVFAGIPITAQFLCGVLNICPTLQECLELVRKHPGKLLNNFLIIVAATYGGTQVVFNVIDGWGQVITVSDRNKATKQVADYLNARSPTVVETYDTPLFYLLDVPYNYPPDSYVVKLEKWRTVPHSERPEYDYSASNPDFVIQGPYSKRVFRTYRGIEEDKRFVLEKTIGDYQIYSPREDSFSDTE